MRDYLRKLFFLTEDGIAVKLAGLFVLLLMVTFLDMLGIGLILPLIDVAMHPDKVSALPGMEAALVQLGISDRADAMLVLGSAIVALYVIKNVAILGLSYIQFRFVNQQQCLFAQRLFSGYVRRSYSRHLRQNSAEVVRNVMMTAPKVFLNGILGFLTIVTEGLMMVGAALVLLVVEPVGSLFAMALVGGTLGTFYMATRGRITGWGGTLEDRTGSMIRFVNEALGAFKEAKLTGRFGFFLKSFFVPNMECASLRTNLNLIGIMPRLVGEVALFLAVFGVVVSLLAQGRDLADAIPVLGLFAAAALRILPSANRMVAAANNIRQSMVPLDGLYEDYRGLMADRSAYADGESPAAPAAPVPLETAIAVDNVSYRYHGAETASLNAVNLTIKKGESVAFVGTTGAGKSTLADVVLGLLGPDEGAVRVDGVDIADNIPGWRRRLGYVPQSIVLLDDTLRRNIAFGLDDADIDDDRVHAVTRLAQVDELIGRLPKGLDAVAGERGVRLSGGERQRIGIARALYHDPDVLVLDEATSALDNVTERKFAQAVDALHGDKTLIIIAHRLATVRRCDRLFLFERGRLADSGTFDELLARNAHFRHMAEADGSGEKTEEPTL